MQRITILNVECLKGLSIGTHIDFTICQSAVYIHYKEFYHIIQSFSPKDDITPEQANEIGKKLCEELYPDFQCVISTHIDKGHIHNHISINAINLYGRKLEDRLSNEKEGLYALSDTSDRISAQYWCYVMPRKTYLKDAKNDFYYQYKEQSFK